MEKLLKILLFVALFIAMWLSRTYALTPEEFAKKEWANPHLISELSDACKTAVDPIHCFGIWLSISKAESQMGNDWTSHWYFGRVASKDKSAYWFVNTYKKKYYIVDKYNEWWMFYWYSPSKPAPTSYCMSEDSSNSKWHCPFGRKSFNFIYSKYKQEVMNDTQITTMEQEKPKLIKTIASKVESPIASNKRCKIVYTTPANWYIQVDDYMGRFINRIRSLKKGTKVFFCWDIK
jgi:hypothetical protein